MALRGVLPALRRGAMCIRRDLSASPTLSAIPFVIENEGRGERSYDIYSRLLRDRIVCVMTPMPLEFNILSHSSLHLEQNLVRMRLTVLQTPHFGEGGGGHPLG
ncbi:hypothetical protein Y032_0001g249 [Ancylostoma ceylanicum]|uniref:ATP-dependent Clp protease proteolytic subunit n=1 Tax=Ancylostoma ceylanicum TaxID=53326 RepID=A0A016W2Q0_9BILA|nr:hypothetical protein Y032_0001g249 [Ancylostoma ceylanicum]